jgi:hypothetical protein
MNTWDLLNDAAALIERDGHVRGRFHDYYGRHCAVGALRRAAGQHEPITPSVHALAAFLRARRPAAFILPDFYSPRNVVTAWNDRIAADAADVIATLRAAAAIEKARHGADQVERHDASSLSVALV